MIDNLTVKRIENKLAKPTTQHTKENENPIWINWVIGEVISHYTCDYTIWQLHVRGKKKINK